MSTTHSGRFNAGLATRLSLLLACGVAFAGPAHGAICRVTSAGTGNGSSWAQAMNLQAALTSASCTEVWVKAGTYVPGNLRSDSFKVLPGVKMYGGFAGTETALGQRNPTANLTTLSGDSGVPNNVSDNNYHVVLMDGTTGAGNIDSSTVLDGFTVTGGNANGDVNLYQAIGGGLFCNGGGSGHQCSPTLNQLKFNENQAGWGGAIFNNGLSGASSPTLTNIVFSNNTATNYGGAVYGDGSTNGLSSPILNRVSFNNNTAGISGGAMMNDGGQGGFSIPILTDVVFSNNHANLAGAMYNNGNAGVSSPQISRTTFSGNTAAASAGAIYNDGRNQGSSTAVISNTTFSNNSNPNEFGGAIYSYAGNGGASSAQLRNVTFSGNSAAYGGAMYNDGRDGGTVAPNLRNVILWGNAGTSGGPEIYNRETAIVQIINSVVENGCASVVGATCAATNFAGDPRLGPLADNGGFTQTMHPGAGSSAIDTGNSSVCANTPVNGLDQRGAVRPFGSGCDIGSVEAGAVIDLIFRNGFDG